MRIAMESTMNELGYERKLEAEPYPRRFTTLVFPLAWPYTVQMSVPEKMADWEFDSLIDFLKLARQGLVRESSR